MKKVLNVIGNVLIALVVIFSVLITTLVILSTRSGTGLPSLFGYSLLTVQSDSMESENGFYVGDIIIIKNLTTEEKNNLKVGDVITFMSNITGEQVIETHRIVEDTYTEYQNQVVDGVWVHGGVHYYVTRGDNTVAIDQWLDGSGPYYSEAGNIIGIWTGQRFGGVGKAMDFLKSSTGFMICIVIPIALFFIYELYVFIMTLTRRQKEKTLQEVADKEAELKAKAVAEFLAQQQSGGEPTPPAEEAKPAAPPADEPAETPADKPAEAAASSPDAISEAEKQRIIQEYLAKQQKPDGE